MKDKLFRLQNQRHSNTLVLLEAAAGELLEVDAGVGGEVHVGEEAVRGAHAVLARAQVVGISSLDLR